MLTAQTYPNSTAQLDTASLPPHLQEAHQWLLRAHPYYSQSEIVKRVADKAIAQLNAYMNPKQAPAKPAPAKKTVANEAQEAIEFLELLLADAQGAEREEIQEAIEYIKILQ